jgi:hypothetical protein
MIAAARETLFDAQEDPRYKTLHRNANYISFSNEGIRALATVLGRFKNRQALNLAENWCNEAAGAALIPELTQKGSVNYAYCKEQPDLLMLYCPWPPSSTP